MATFTASERMDVASEGNMIDRHGRLADPMLEAEDYPASLHRYCERGSKMGERKRVIGQASQVSIMEVSEDALMEVAAVLKGLGIDDRFFPRYIERGEMKGFGIDMHGIFLACKDRENDWVPDQSKIYQKPS